MSADQKQTTEDKEDRTAERFEANLAALLNSPWPPRALTEPHIVKKAKALAAQLHNWESWK